VAKNAARFGDLDVVEIAEDAVRSARDARK
jgi:hypothetical protein